LWPIQFMAKIVFRMHQFAEHKVVKNEL